jgi:hypothetical protein
MKQIVCRKYCTNYDIDLAAFNQDNNSSAMAGLGNRNMSV